MKFGCSLFGMGPQHYARVAAHAEQHGFESVWIPEHLLFPAEMPATYPYTESGYPPVNPRTPLSDPWIVLAYVAHATETIRLGTNVFILPLRHPLVTARQIVTLDRLSGGRVTLGAGVGWLADEFAALGLPFAERGKMMDEAVPLLRRLWTEDTIEHHGKYYSFDPIKFEPKPVQKPCPPIEIGGGSPAALRRAGRLGDGWIEIGAGDLDGLEAKLRVINEARRAAGRDHLPFEVTTFMGARDLDTMRKCEALGVTRVLAGPPFTGVAVTVPSFLEFIERFAEDVIAKA